MLALWLTGDLSRVYPVSRPMSHGIGSSPPATLKDKQVQLKDGWVDYHDNIIVDITPGVLQLFKPLLVLQSTHMVYFFMW